MQSCFRVSDMDSTNEPPSPMAAAASDKRMFRICTNCTNRMPSIDFDAHTLCIGCRQKVCDMSVHCDECRDWTDSYRDVVAARVNIMKRSSVPHSAGCTLLEETKAACSTQAKISWQRGPLSDNAWKDLLDKSRYVDTTEIVDLVHLITKLLLLGPQPSDTQGNIARRKWLNFGRKQDISARKPL